MTPPATARSLGVPDAPYAALGAARPPLSGDRAAEVVVVGGGIVGATTALMLAERGHEVLLLEAHRVGGGTSGRSTGKVTSQHGAVYAELLQRHGRDTAVAYARTNTTAIADIERLVDRYRIECQLEPIATYLHATTSAGAEKLRHEVDVARSLGLPATLTGDAPVPDTVRAGLRYDDQRQFDPRAYTMGLVEAAESQGVVVHEGTALRKVRPGRGSVAVHTDGGVVQAEQVVLAMLTPWPDVVGAFARATPSRAACVAAELTGPVPKDASLGIDGPARSSRRFVPPGANAEVGGGRELLILLASGWRPGTSDESAVLHELADEAVHRWGAVRVTHHWAAMDQVSSDKLPLVGGLPGLPRIHAASGFSKWGMTGGTVAAELLAARVEGDRRAHPFDPARFPDARAWGKMLRANLRDGYELARQRLPVPGTAPDLDLSPGDGCVVATLRGPVAVSADGDGRRCAVSATCTHLGCTVRWNRAGSVWECACHGSRFAPTGEVLGGPATTPLSARDVPSGRSDGPSGGRVSS